MSIPKTGPPGVTQRIDYDGSNNPIYIGEADPTTVLVDPLSAIWRIRRISYVGTNPVLIEWADGNRLYDNVWNDRAGLTYH